MLIAEIIQAAFDAAQDVAYVKSGEVLDLTTETKRATYFKNMRVAAAAVFREHDNAAYALATPSREDRQIVDDNNEFEVFVHLGGEIQAKRLIQVPGGIDTDGDGQ